MMMRLFRLVNRGRYAWWMIAKSLESAKEFAVKIGNARHVNNVRLVGDQTDFYLDGSDTASTLQAVLDGDKEGIAHILHTQNGSSWQIAGGNQ